jgi:hypothetical protein
LLSEDGHSDHGICPNVVITEKGTARTGAGTHICWR